jgi:hypothetical protein
MCLLLGRRTPGPLGLSELSQCGSYLLGLHRQGWITSIADQPLELYAYLFGRPCLKADTVDLRFRVGLGKPRPVDHDFNTT